MRRSEDIVSIWEEILIDTQADLGDERWMILEQVRSISKYGTSLIRGPNFNLRNCAVTFELF